MPAGVVRRDLRYPLHASVTNAPFVHETQIDHGESLHGGKVHECAKRWQLRCGLPRFQGIGLQIAIASLGLAVAQAHVHYAIPAPYADAHVAGAHVPNTPLAFDNLRDPSRLCLGEVGWLQLKSSRLQGGEDYVQTFETAPAPGVSPAYPT